MTYRKPPKPDYYHTTEPGTCRWCNEVIGLTRTGRPSKSRWHPACVEEYNRLNSPTKTRDHVWRRDKGICRGCGAQCRRKGVEEGWEMDHIVPLIEDHSSLDCWRDNNCQTLCLPCHTAKTSREATERAASRKVQII